MSSTEPSRNSGALRASVLAVAMSGGVAQWIFETIDEQGEESVTSPGLTSGSTTASEESSISPYQFSKQHLRFTSEDGANTGSVALANPAYDPLQHTVTFEAAIPRGGVPAADTSFATPEPPVGKRKKLVKAKKTADGDESDGGYISDGWRKLKERRAKRKALKADDQPAEAGNESDGGYLSESVNGKQGKKGKPTAGDDSLLVNIHSLMVKELDSATSPLSGKAKKKAAASAKTKPSTTDSTAGDESDGGYLSEGGPAKRKKSFFSRAKGLKASKSQTSLHTLEAPAIPPVPAMPQLPLPLPIADRFTRSPTPSGHSDNHTAHVSTALSSRSTTPVGAVNYGIALNTEQDRGNTAVLASPRIALDLQRPLRSARKGSDSSEATTRPSVDSKHQRPSQSLDKERPTSPPISPAASRSPKLLTRQISPEWTSPVRSHGALTRQGSPVLTPPTRGMLSRQVSPEVLTPSRSRSPPARKITPALISAPNPHLISSPQSQAERRAVSPLRLASPLQSPYGTRPPTLPSMSPGIPPSPRGGASSEPRRPRPNLSVTPLPWDQSLSTAPFSRRPSALSVVPSSEYIVPSPMASPNTQGTPDHPDELLPPRRSSFLAQYSVVPPSPPPTCPLPSLPTSHPPRALSPARPPGIRGPPRRLPDVAIPAPTTHASRAPPTPVPNAPLPPTPPTSAPVRLDPPAGGLFSQPIPAIRRGKQAPFPAQPILPRDESAGMMRRPSAQPRAERYRGLPPDVPRGADGPWGAPGAALGWSSSALEVPAYPVGSIVRSPAEARASADDDEDDKSRYSSASYLDGNRSAEVRERFLKRVQAMYDIDGREVETDSDLDDEDAYAEMSTDSAPNMPAYSHRYRPDRSAGKTLRIGGTEYAPF